MNKFILLFHKPYLLFIRLHTLCQNIFNLKYLHTIGLQLSYNFNSKRAVRDKTAMTSLSTLNVTRLQ